MKTYFFIMWVALTPSSAGYAVYSKSEFINHQECTKRAKEFLNALALEFRRKTMIMCLEKIKYFSDNNKQ